MTQPRRILGIVGFVATFLLLPLRAPAQSGTVTDDGFVSINPTTQQLNVNGYGMVLIVAGSSAIGSPGKTTAFLKFQLQSSLPPNVAAANVAKAALKLFLANQGPSPSGAINIYPVTSAWADTTLNPSAPPTLAASPFATGITVAVGFDDLSLELHQRVRCTNCFHGARFGGC
jgi:hypothetical protein